MPELPEVENTVRFLEKKVLQKTFLDVWTDFKWMIKKPKDFEQFKKGIKGKRIEKIWRRGKNIIFGLGSSKYLLIHQKLTGHLLLGRWKLENARPPGLRPGEVGRGKWQSEIEGPLKKDPMNKFLHLIFYLDSGEQLALSDLRKFAKVELLSKEELEKELEKLGPDPLERGFTLEKFREILKKKKRGKIKKVLMDQSVISGVGNIYSDETLWKAKVHPLKEISKLTDKEIERIYFTLREILTKSIELGGESISDYRRPDGKKGDFEKIRSVYRREGEECKRCGAKIRRLKVNNRSSYFCPVCQKL